MSLFLTNYFLFEDMLKLLDNEFEVKLRKNIEGSELLFKTDRSFLFSNIMSIIDFNNYHNLNDINPELFDNRYIKKKAFDREIIQINLAQISYTTLKRYTDKYLTDLKGGDSITKSRDIDILFAKSRGLDLKLGLSKLFDRSFVVSFKHLDYIKYLFNNQSHFPMGDVYFKNNLEKINKIFKKKGLYFAFHKKYKQYNYFAKPGFSDEFINSKFSSNKSYNEIYEMALDECVENSIKYLKGLLL